jgi:hypothetical protein
MTTINLPLYRFLVDHGATEDQAEAAASFDVSALATKGDLQDLRLATKADLLAFEARLGWRIGTLVVSSLVSLTAIFALIVGWMVRHP